jgi:hypothetical protein
LFATAHRRLASLGLRVPEIYLLDRDRVYYLAVIAILEDFPGEDLLAFWEGDPVAAGRLPGCVRHWRQCATAGRRARQGELHRRRRDTALADE